MPARSAGQAVQEFKDQVGLVISCVTKGVENVGGGYHPSPTPHVVILGRGVPVRLSGLIPLSLAVRLQYRVVEHPSAAHTWRVAVVGYEYGIRDQEGRELLAYHWNPGQAVTFPHLHLSFGGEIGPLTIRKMHLPTGYVSVRDVIWLLISELGVKPLRDDWEHVLAQTQTSFE